MKILRLLTDPVTVLEQVSETELTKRIQTGTGKPSFFGIHEEIEFDVVPDAEYERRDDLLLQAYGTQRHQRRQLDTDQCAGSVPVRRALRSRAVPRQRRAGDDVEDPVQRGGASHQS